MNHPFTSGDFPANPLEKPGYRLDVHDEFDDPNLNTNIWLPFYLPQWSSRTRTATNYRIENGNLLLEIVRDQQPWCPEFDGTVKCSSLQTGVFSGPLGSKQGQHRFNQACIVREEQPIQHLYTPHYGYIELRAKCVNTPKNLVSLWMIGFEDTHEKSGEIAVMEVFGKDVNASTSLIGYGVHPWADPTLVDEFYRDPFPINATDFHIYAVDWTPTKVDFYLDNYLINTINQSPAYEMQFMLGVYELPSSEPERESPNMTSTYPTVFVIDYLRVYQPLGGYSAN